MNPSHVLLFCVFGFWVERASSHGSHDDEDFDPDAPIENKLNKRGFVMNKE